ncbi:MAG: succinate dehydrogenase, cytochrome b556 subunit [Azoarcus sp.]|jgi:succinate dehydrogenase / fumarate reductase cytochrome b subunit|nr:succinate dehydrogenase, cytochrome b556 subunit [Azoarcus sp.]
MTEATIRKRPKHLALWQIHFPVPAIMSIAHRISGAGLFLLLPFLIYLLGKSLGSPESFAEFKACIAHPLVKLVLLGLLWAYMHHFCAGIRYLFLDIDKGVDLACARKTAIAVFAVSLTLTAVIGVKLW